MDFAQHLFIGCVETRTSRGHGGQSTEPGRESLCLHGEGSAVSKPSRGAVPLLPALSSLVFWRVAEAWSEPSLAEDSVVPPAGTWWSGEESRCQALDTPRLIS